MRISDWSSDVCSSDLRDSLYDGVDGEISFIDILYFTTVTITTVGYGDIVPVTPTTRLFEAIIVTPIRIFVWLIFLGTAYHFVIRNTYDRWRMARIQKTLQNHIVVRSEEHTSELQSLMRISYAVFCLKKKKNTYHITKQINHK